MEGRLYLDIVEAAGADDSQTLSEAFEEALATVIHHLIEQKKYEVAGNLVERKYMPTVRKVGRLDYIRIRIRHGKVQRMKKKSAVKGWTYRGGHLVRMRPSERLHRRMAARRAKIKRRAKRSQIRRHMMIAMRKRRALGLSYRPFGR